MDDPKTAENPVSINEPPGSDVIGKGGDVKAPAAEAPKEADDTADPDELEEEIEEAEDDGDVETHHRGTPTKTMSHKRSKAKR